MASRRKGDRITERVTGYELLLELLAQGNKLGWRFYFLGTDEHTSCKAVEKITKLYPNVKIAGRHNGFLTKEEEPAIVAEIQHAQPDFLIVAMGAPYSDKWVYKHKPDLTQVKVSSKSRLFELSLKRLFLAWGEAWMLSLEKLRLHLRYGKSSI
jgi:N-acetylglucosaminyldiphosphoundecaprenol N-acetyl-beta-D-mannosaminyltransferase